MEHPFWSVASLLLTLPDLQIERLERDGAAWTFTFGSPNVATKLVVRARDASKHGAPVGRPGGELSLGGLAMRYEIRGPVPDGLGPALSSWMRALVDRWPHLERLASPSARLADLGEAESAPLTGWQLARDVTEGDVTLYEFGERQSEHRVLLEGRRAEDGGSLRLKHRTPAPLAIQEALRVTLSLLLDLRTQATKGSAETPSPRARNALEVIAAPGAHQSNEVRLVLNGPCLQHCAFCSIPDTFLPSDEGEVELAAHRAVLEARFREGVRKVRLTGVDPLASSFVLELVRHATALGYEEMLINSPCTRLADRGFAEALVAAMPKGRAIVVPLYALDASIHDRVVGRVGAYALVREAIDHLLELLEHHEVRLSTVLTPDVLGALPPLVQFAQAKSLAMNLYLPFPDADSPLDRFQRVTLPQEEVARSLVAGGALSLERLFHVAGLAPCVVLRALPAGERARAEAWLKSPEGRLTTNDGARTAHDACVHRARCALVPPCEGTLLRAYVARHGTAEFLPP